ncbi:MAG TPA: hypothetical protein VGH91_13295 [Gammaproteobacteria bacterium]|jgi:hypothetical protein
MRRYLFLVFLAFATPATAGASTDVDGVEVSGNVQAMPLPDIQSAIAETRHHIHKLSALEVIDRDVIHAYLGPRDLGWVGVTRTTYHEPDGSTSQGWSVAGLGLPNASGALDCIKDAQQVYVFPNTNPKQPHRDDKHMRLLDPEARAALVGVIGAKEDWWQGLYELGIPDKPDTDVGFVFKTGECELVLFFMDNATVVGTLNGESLKGLLNSSASRKLDKWTGDHALVEMSVPSETPSGPVHTPLAVKQVNGISVIGDLSLVSDRDVDGAFAAFKDAGLSEPELLVVMGKDEIRGYVQDDVWMTARRTDCAAAGDGQHPCWAVPPRRLPGYPDALRCIQNALYVHGFPVASPLKHFRNFDHDWMLDDSPRRELIDLLGAKESWSGGADSTIVALGKLPADFGFELNCGNDQVRLFFSSDGRVQGDYNGEYLSGTLGQTAAQALQTWEAKYAQPAPAAH